MKLAETRRVRRAPADASVINGGVHDPEANYGIKLAPSIMLTIRRRRPPKRLPWWQAGVLLVWLAALFFYNGINPEGRVTRELE